MMKAINELSILSIYIFQNENTNAFILSVSFRTRKFIKKWSVIHPFLQKERQKQLLTIRNIWFYTRKQEKMFLKILTMKAQMCFDSFKQCQISLFLDVKVDSSLIILTSSSFFFPLSNKGAFSMKTGALPKQQRKILSAVSDKFILLV